MTPSFKKPLSWIFAAIGIVTLAFAGLVLVAPTLVNLQSVKREIETVTSREVGGTVTTSEIALSFLPRPRIVLEEPRISIPGSVEGRLRSLDIQIRLLPLLKRTLQVSSVELHEPDFTITVRPDQSREGKKASKQPKQWTEREIAGLFASFTVKTAGLTTSVNKGRISIRENDSAILVVRDIDLSVLVPADQPVAKAVEGAGKPLPQFMITGRIERSIIEAPAFPGPVPVSIDRFTATSELFTFKNLSITMLDGSAEATGSFPRYLRGIRRVELSGFGKMGSRIEEWIRTRAGVALQPALRTPIEAKNVRLLITQGKEASLSAELLFGGGPTVSFSAGIRPEQVWIRKCRISDADSQAELGARITNQDIEASFEGTLTDASLGRLFREERQGSRRISGMMRARTSRSAPFLRTFDGSLDAENFVIPLKQGMQLEIQKLALQGEGTTVQITSAELLWSSVPFRVKGIISLHPEYLDLDMDAAAGNLDLQVLRQSLESKEPAEQPGPVPTHGIVPFPVQGEVRITAESLSLGAYTFQPIHAAVIIRPESVSLKPAEAVLCGIGLSGSVEFRKKRIAVDIRATAENKPIEETLACFKSKDHDVTGSFSLVSRLSGSGPSDDVPGLLNGPIEVKAVNGNIKRMFTVARILDLVNKTEVFRGKYPSLGKEGLRFNSLSIKGKVEDGVLTVNEGMMDGTTMEMAAEGTVDLVQGDLDFRVAVAPLKTVDAVVKKVPLVKDILRGTLIVVPFRVSGTLSKPDVSSISLADAGKGVSGIFSRTLKAPYKFVEGLVPGGKSKP